jgi:hypothetical protein
LLTDTPEGRKRRKTRTKALDAPSFLIHRNDQRRAAYGMDVRYELSQLVRVGVVASKEDDAADQRMPQQVALLGFELGALEVDHQRPERHDASR